MNDDNDEFANWWRAPAQEELRKSCAMGWGRYIWQASRAALKVELPEQLPPAIEVAGKMVHTAKDAKWNACLERVKEALQQAGIEVAK